LSVRRFSHVRSGSDRPAAAEVSLDPIRARPPAEPASATALAAKVGLPRQKVNYQLKALERQGPGP
jgi:hypothetical protein